ncbi:7401_t:CDS:2, partial [Gigaspora rosea]
FIEVLLNAILNSTSLPRKHSNFKELADLRSIEICQSEVFDQISLCISSSYWKQELDDCMLIFRISYTFKFSATLLPYVTVILEIHNNSVFPNLRALSILFMWFFCISQLRFIEGIGIFIAVALMNSTYEKLNEHARAVWIAHVAQFVSVMLPFAEYLESYDSSESQKSLNNFKLQDIKDASYIVYDVPTSYFNEQEQIVLAKELCGMSKISDYDPKKFEKMSKMLDIDS